MQEQETITMPKSWREKLEDLAIGGSIPVTGDQVEACRAAISRLNGSTDKRFTTRRVDRNDPESEVFAWRLK